MAVSRSQGPDPLGCQAHQAWPWASLGLHCPPPPCSQGAIKGTLPGDPVSRGLMGRSGAQCLLLSAQAQLAWPSCHWRPEIQHFPPLPPLLPGVAFILNRVCELACLVPLLSRLSPHRPAAVPCCPSLCPGAWARLLPILASGPGTGLPRPSSSATCHLLRTDLGPWHSRHAWSSLLLCNLTIVEWKSHGGNQAGLLEGSASGVSYLNSLSFYVLMCS